MKARPYKAQGGSGKVSNSTNSYVEEALAKQAASRPPKTPPKLMPVTPTLPRIPKPKGRRRRKVGDG